MQRNNRRKRRSFQSLEQRQLLAATLSIPVEISIGDTIPAEVEVYSSSQGRIAAVNGRLRLDDAQPGGSYAYNEFVLRVDMQEMNEIRLKFDHDSINDEKHTIPSQYTGRVRGDGVSISVDDGQTWYRVVQLDRDFRNRSFDLDAIILDAGLDFSSETLIRFQQWDNYSANSDGRAFGNIKITGVPDRPEAAPQPLPYRQDFSAGMPGLDAGWEFNHTADGRARLVDQALLLDDATNGGYSLNEAILHLDLAGERGVNLSLSHENHRDENHSIPISFQGPANGDGISFSNDGQTWYGLASLTSSYDDGQFNLDQAIATAGIEYTADFQIKLSQYDNYSLGWDGRSFDDILVTTAARLPTSFSVQDDLNGFINISGADLDRALAVVRPSDNGLIGYGQAIVDVAQRLDINPFYIAAHAAWETGWGNSRIFLNKNNAFGYGAFDRCPYSCAVSFATVEAGIEFAMTKVKENYLTPGGKYYHGSTLNGMNVRYATDPNWQNGIAGIMNSLQTL